MRLTRSRLPYRSQVEAADCGAACLAITLGWYGRATGLDEVRAATGSGRDGVNVHSLVQAARAFGLEARAIKTELDDLRELPTGSILYWDLRHFVVLERIRRDGIVVMDPALGRRTVSWEDADRSYSGVALVLSPGPGFVRVRRRRSRVRRLLDPVLRQREAIARLLALSLGGRVLGLALPLTTGVVVDEVVERSDGDVLPVLAWVCAATVATFFGMTWLRARLLVDLRAAADEQITSGFVRHLVRLPLDFHLRRGVGDLMLRLRSIALVRELLTTAAMVAVLDGLFVVLYLAVLLLMLPPLALLVLILAAVQLLVLLLARGPLERLAAESLHRQTRTQSYAFQLFSGFRGLKAMGVESRGADRFDDLFQAEVETTVHRGRTNALVESVLVCMRLSSPLLLLFYVVAQVLDGRLTLGSALAGVAIAGGVLEPLGALVSTALTLQVVRSYLERIDDVLDAEPEQVPENAVPLGRPSGDVEVRDVRFRYSVHAPWVVDEVSLQVPAGGVLAIVGPSGSGKSTLANLLLGLYRPAEGEVLWDGVDLAEVDTAALRRHVGVVTQETHLFDASIRDNIALVDPAMPLDDVVAAARIAAVDADVSRFPLGYETLVGEGGGALSGGQRQRIAIARAVAANPAVLLLDEATSQLDPVTERRVLENLSTLGCTRIFVTHRLALACTADLVAVMEGGRLVEFGPQSRLLRRRGPFAAAVREMRAQGRAQGRART